MAAIESVDTGQRFFVVAFNARRMNHVVEEHNSVIAAIRRKTGLDTADTADDIDIVALIGDSLDDAIRQNPECFIGDRLDTSVDDYIS